MNLVIIALRVFLTHNSDLFLSLSVKTTQTQLLPKHFPLRKAPYVLQLTAPFVIKKALTTVRTYNLII